MKRYYGEQHKQDPYDCSISTFKMLRIEIFFHKVMKIRVSPNVTQKLYSDLN